MNLEMLEIMKTKKGFIAALDQSGGSSKKTLELYGISQEKYQTEEEMFNYIHDMRTRIIKSPSFNDNYILGVILFEQTMNRMIDGEYTSLYLWEKKHILSFLKVDQGLALKENGVQLMKPINNLLTTLTLAKERNIFGTKMRSVIYENNQEGIRQVVQQQFVLAKTIFENGFIPIIEPEVSIDALNKKECETILKEEINTILNQMPQDMKVIFKFTIPTIPNFYADLMNNPRVVRIVALSGGYSRDDACQKLIQNTGLIASFSRALLENLNVNDSNEEFDQKLKQAIKQIYDASIV